MRITPLQQIRSRRQRLNLTQTELGLLAGASDASAVSRQEAGLRLPDLRSAIAYHVVLQSRIEDLFPDLVEEITAEVAARAVSLAAALRQGPVDQRTAAVLRRLSEITGDETIEYGEDTLF
jgi:transcriptional regulator with XRE-family HTH domain